MIILGGNGVSYIDEELAYIYDKTDGYCHLCDGKVAWKNYANFGSRGAWEVDHSNPIAAGGTDYYRNLFAAHISCNRSKGAMSSREFRRLLR